MNKILTAAVALTFATLSATAMACPKGTTLQGGTGPNHKGGKCVAVVKKDAVKPVKKVDEKTKTVETKPAPAATKAETKPAVKKVESSTH